MSLAVQENNTLARFYYHELNGIRKHNLHDTEQSDLNTGSLSAALSDSIKDIWIPGCIAAHLALALKTSTMPGSRDLSLYSCSYFPLRLYSIYFYSDNH